MLSQDFRPKTFDAFIGQGGIVAEMKSRSLTMNFPKVMIFEGDSGTGKTSMAFLVASLLNDDSPIPKGEGDMAYFDPNPESPALRDIYSESFSRPDVKFYDASSMSKGDVLEVEQFVGMNPMFDNKRIAIIDEAQELSRAGKGATLRLLEKSRSNAYIILCTMNADALDEAVLSRGTRFTFRKVAPGMLAKGLYDILNQLDVEVPDEFISEGIFTLAENVEGSVRTGLQYLDRCLASKNFSADGLQDEFGFISSEKMTVILKELLSLRTAVNLFSSKLDLKKFLHTAFAYMGEAAQYSITGKSTVQWKKDYTLQIKDQPYFEEFYVLLAEMIARPYFHAGLFIQKIWSYARKEPLAFTTRTPVS